MELQDIPTDELPKLEKELALITSEPAQRLLQEAARAHSPISMEKLNVMEGLRDENLFILYSLERLRLFNASFEERNGRTEKVFHITDLGRHLLLR